MLRMLLVVWSVFFMLTRVHMLHSAISRLSTERNNERWLLHQCQHDEFYHNMKHHSALCDEVSTKADDVLLLHAIREVVENSYVCGFYSCVDIVDVAIASTAKQSMYVLTSAVCVLILAPSLLFPLWRRSLGGVMSTIAERRISQQRPALRYHACDGYHNDTGVTVLGNTQLDEATSRRHRTSHDSWRHEAYEA
jgi:hypothetical protein